MRFGIRELFALDERLDIEDVELVQSEHEAQALYLFQWDDLFLKRQRLAIDEQRGIVGTYQEHHIVNKIHMSMVEIAILTLLLLSSPLPVYEHMIENICILHNMNEGKSDEMFKNAIHDLVRTCNEKLRILKLALASLEDEYCLTAIGENF